ncbi:hypothetical protein OG21DRAFT_1604248 [Imleria badia]|nr:hypothetical protein OG21DRAFT_1604248 [Imleria badia]
MPPIYTILFPSTSFVPVRLVEAVLSPNPMEASSQPWESLSPWYLFNSIPASNPAFRATDTITTGSVIRPVRDMANGDNRFTWRPDTVYYRPMTLTSNHSLDPQIRRSPPRWAKNHRAEGHVFGTPSTLDNLRKLFLNCVNCVRDRKRRSLARVRKECDVFEVRGGIYTSAERIDTFPAWTVDTRCIRS